jgi:hypothetical protein
MRAFEVRTCRVAELFDDPRSAELIAAYAEECGSDLIGKPAPRRDIYENLERSLGQCFIGSQDGKLCGFAFLVIAVVPHYGLSCATLESLFVEQESAAGTALMRCVEAFAKGEGCTTIFYSAPVNSRLAELLFVRSDVYTLTYHGFSRRLI